MSTHWQLIAILPHPPPRNYPEGLVQDPLYPSRFCGSTSYQRPGTHDLVPTTYDPRLLVTPEEGYFSENAFLARTRR